MTEDLSHLNDIITPDVFNRLKNKTITTPFTLLVVFTSTRSEIGILNVTDDLLNPANNHNRAIVKTIPLIDALNQHKIKANSVVKVTDFTFDPSRGILNIKNMDVI